MNTIPTGLIPHSSWLCQAQLCLPLKPCPTGAAPGHAVDDPGTRAHPPYTPEWEALYQQHLALRDEGRSLILDAEGNIIE